MKKGKWWTFFFSITSTSGEEKSQFFCFTGGIWLSLQDTVFLNLFPDLSRMTNDLLRKYLWLWVIIVVLLLSVVIILIFLLINKCITREGTSVSAPLHWKSLEVKHCIFFLFHTYFSPSVQFKNITQLHWNIFFEPEEEKDHPISWNRFLLQFLSKEQLRATFGRAEITWAGEQVRSWVGTFSLTTKERTTGFHTERLSRSGEGFNRTRVYIYMYAYIHTTYPRITTTQYKCLLSHRGRTHTHINETETETVLSAAKIALIPLENSVFIKCFMLGH